MANYASPKAYRAALEARIVNEHQKTGEDINRIRKKVAFDATLARINANDRGFVLKGGYAMELRLEVSRATKDLDFVTKRILRSKLTEFKEESSERLRSILEACLLSKTNQDDDYFDFNVGEAMIEITAGGGGYRYPIEARLDGRRFESFHIDVSIGDFVTDINDHIKRKSKARISDKGPSSFNAELITKEQHFAEKIHAYTMPRDGVNSRAKDLVDLVLLIRDGFDEKAAYQAMTQVFSHRATHSLPDALHPPPLMWKPMFEKLARECSLSLSMQDAYELIAKAYLRCKNG